jgi:prepilin signal peptidase PulO-like enzyme (type II secretory pathway)
MALERKVLLESACKAIAKQLGRRVDIPSCITYYGTMFQLIVHAAITCAAGWLLLPIFDGKILKRDLGGSKLKKALHGKPDERLPRVMTALFFSGSTTIIYSMVTSFAPHTPLQVLLIMLFSYTSIAPLLYLAISDMDTMQVPRTLLLVYTSGLVLLNLALLFPNGVDSAYHLWELRWYIPVQNLIAGITLAGGTALIVILTKGRGMGRADIAIAASIGLLNGYAGSVLGVYIAVFSALLYGLIVSIPKRTIKNVKIPFIPFLVLGAVSAFILPDDFLVTLLTSIRY